MYIVAKTFELIEKLQNAIDEEEKVKCNAKLELIREFVAMMKRRGYW